MIDSIESQAELILAAEDCPEEHFDDLHKFPTQADHRIITTLVAHGPVLLKGGRGSGKSAFMIAASRRLFPSNKDAVAVGLYMSLRHAPLLKSTGDAYERILCDIIISKIRDVFGDEAIEVGPVPRVRDVQGAISKLAKNLGKRFVLYFDDAAHLGREASLEDFFDVYRTLSSSAISCKATIYPGVTRFGTRFDVYNDATVIDLARSEELPGFSETFLDVMNARYPSSFPASVFRHSLPKSLVSAFLAQATLGNMRGFVFACNELKRRCISENVVGIPELSETLIHLASNYYWPLLEEVQPKLGQYEPMVGVARELSSLIFEDCGQKPKNPRDILVHREVDEKLSKPFQILEYAGFVSKREVSRGMKSGGRGARYALNLCNLLEMTPGSRLTHSLFGQWTGAVREEAVQFGRASTLSEIVLPEVPENQDVGIFSQAVDILGVSDAYPYGLSEQKIVALRDAGYKTVGDLVLASDEDLDRVRSIGSAMIRKIRNVLGQAIWM